MGAPRRNPPSNAIAEIRALAAAGSTYIGIAKRFKVSKDTLTRWLDDDPALAESFEQGKDEEREKLHNSLSVKALAGDIVAAMFLLKSRHKYDDKAGQRIDVSVDARTQSVMYVKDFGSDEEWAARAALHQRELALSAGAPGTSVNLHKSATIPL
jgi:hypothetical protein